MSVFTKHHDALEHHETMMGPARGRLAVALDLLTDSLALVGQHGVYCRSDRFPGKPKLDIALVLHSPTFASEAGFLHGPLKNIFPGGFGPESLNGGDIVVKMT